MSTPTIPAKFTSPVLDAKSVQDLQELFEDELFNWLQLVYPVARVGLTKDAEGNEFKYPQIYVNDGNKEYYDIRPNDDLNSYGFFELNNEPEFNDDGEIKYNLSFIVWYNLNKVDNGRSHDFSRDLIKDVLRVIDESEFKNQVQNLSYEVKQEDIFNKYSLSITDSQYLTYPYGAFKLTFDFIDYESRACTAFTRTGGGDCPENLTPCQLLINSLTADKLNTCILPSYDFSSTGVTNNLTTIQEDSLIDLLCTPTNINVSNSDDSYSVSTSNNLELPDSNITGTTGNIVLLPATNNYQCAQINTLSCQNLNDSLNQTQRDFIHRRTILKTGQTTSTRTGDDGDLEYGFGTSFIVLPCNNSFGNTNRFTDSVGGQIYGAGNGSLVNYIIDHATGLGWLNQEIAISDWNTSIDNAEIATNLGFTNWHIPNNSQWMSIMNLENFQVFNYAPFNKIFSDVIWSSSQYKTGVDIKFFTFNDGRISFQAMANNAVSFYLRQHF